MLNRLVKFVASLSFLATCQAQELDFNRDIRPILSDKCYACHGPDAAQREAGLRLDTREGAFADLGGYQAITAGAPADSELIARITAEDDALMPPREHPKQLSAEEKQTLAQWIAEGAKWSEHWAYVPPKRSVPPSIASQWSGNWIDAFVVQRLESEGISPSHAADARTLVRRLSFDLTGLPPSLEDIALLAEQPTDANYEQLVDRFLRSPHFGERMATYWLDLVRYADTVGYHGDQDVSVSPYRDYVIKAFNDNKPFDEFTREQLAGDLLPEPTLEQLVASGYNKLGMMSAEGGVQPEEYLVKYAADRVRTASTVWLGSTLGCAECHNHKFDPFTAEDFYRFSAFFADIKERGLYSGANRDGNWGPSIEVADPELSSILQPIDARIQTLTEQLKADTPELAQAKATWVETQREMLSSWKAVSPLNAVSLNGAKLEVQSDQSVLVSGASPATDTYTLELDLQSGAKAIRVDVLPHKSLPQAGAGRAKNGNFVITEVRLTPIDSSQDPSVDSLKFESAVASFEQADGNAKNPWGKWAAAATIDGDEQGANWGWAVLPNVGTPQSLVLELADAIQPGLYHLHLVQNHQNPQHTVGHFSIHVNTSPAGTEEVVSNPVLRAALMRSESERTKEDHQQIAEAFAQMSPELEPVRRELAKTQAEKQALIEQHTRSTLITQSVEPRTIRVLPRGNWMDRSGEIVDPGVPHFLEQVEASRRLTRLDLADWLVSRQNPLTARVFVNRVWKLLFGTGLSKVLDDLGAQGELPSHPELLDTLAVEFMESGWDVKRLVRLIVMSYTYRQSSLVRQDLQVQDPYNRLLARQSRFRLDAEFIRDNALATSGLLVQKVGGRSVKPYQPEGLYRHLNFPARTYQADSGQEQYRRGVYTHWQRQFLHPAMQAFDAPAREECTADRPRSNTPLAALVLLNDPSYVEAARAFAEHAIQEEADVDSRLRWMARRALSRLPSSEEVRVLRTLLESEIKSYSKSPKEAQALVEIGLSPPADLDFVELAAWTTVARSIMNMHEFVTRN